MYVGRIVLVGREGKRSFVGYRVSSRSFPNRRTEVRGSSVFVYPSDPQDLARNPYIAYNCIRTLEGAAVVANGSHSDMIMDHLQDGVPPLNALSLSLLAFGYERDELCTPRIAAVVQGVNAWMGIVSRDELRVKGFTLQEGDAYMVATYEVTEFRPMNLEGKDAVSIARAAFGLPYERPVCSAAAMEEEGGGYSLGAYNLPDV